MSGHVTTIERMKVASQPTPTSFPSWDTKVWSLFAVAFAAPVLLLWAVLTILSL